MTDDLISCIADIFNQDTYPCSCQAIFNALNDLSAFTSCSGTISCLEDLFDIIIYYYQAKGKRISDLDKTTDIDNSSLFIVSKFDNEKYSSSKICLDDFEEELTRYILKRMNVGTMAFQNALSYSKKEHFHDDRYVHMTYISSDQTQQYDQLNIATLSIGLPGSETLDGCAVLSVNTPTIHYDMPMQPEVGTLKFVYMKSNSNCKTNHQLIASSSFDGWVYPNGDEIMIDPIRFADAYAIYKCGSNKIKLPNLDEFFKAAGHSVSNFNKKAAHLSYVNHQHNVNPVNFSGTLAADSKTMPTYTSFVHGASATYRKKGIHAGYSTTKVTTNVTLNLANVKFNDLETSTFGSNNVDGFKPEHIELPIMIYIGGVNN